MRSLLVHNSWRVMTWVLVVAAGVSFGSAAVTGEPKIELLWPNGAPDAKGDAPADKPTLTIWLADAAKNTGTAVVVCPGGGYGGLATDHEGKQIAQWFNSMGVSAFVLEYRHRGRGYGHPAPLQDAQRAIRTVRAGAEQFKINPKQIGILGFSAGGHLASTAATHFDHGVPDAKDPIEKVSCRPDFAVLCYAVIAFGESFTHYGSQENLIGKNAPADLVKSLSNEKQVTSETPPTFLWHTNEDNGVPADNSVAFYMALRKAKVPAELHIYRAGQHGLGLAPSVVGTRNWAKDCEDWLRGMKMLEAKAGN